MWVTWELGTVVGVSAGGVGSSLVAGGFRSPGGSTLWGASGQIDDAQLRGTMVVTPALPWGSHHRVVRAGIIPLPPSREQGRLGG